MPARISEDVDLLIRYTWLRMREQGRDMSANEVLISAREWLDSKNSTHIKLPSKRKVEYILHETRERYDNLSSEEKALNALWSMATLSRHDVPYASLDHVLQVWKLCQFEGESYTIRQARWASWLSVSIKDTFALKVMSRLYANRELACRLLGTTFQTDDLDMVWSTPPWVLATMYLMGITRLPIGFYEGNLLDSSSIKATRIKDTSLFFAGSGLIELDSESIHFETSKAEHYFIVGPNYPEEMLDEEDLSDEPEDLDKLDEVLARFEERANEMYDGPLSVLRGEDITAIGFSIEAERVYTLWLKYLYCGPCAVHLSPDDRLEILLKLRKWATNHSLATNSESLRQSMSKLAYIDVAELANEFDLEPAELLIKVGYNL